VGAYPKADKREADIIFAARPSAQQAEEAKSAVLN
jgi:hypothetical protein